MEPLKRFFTKGTFQDNNFGDGMFKGAADADEELNDKSDMSKGNRREYLLFKRNIMMEFRKQYKDTKRSLDALAVNALEEFDDVVGNTLTPSSCLNANDQNEQKYNMKGINADPTTATGDKQDPDKIFRQYPSFDPVFMKV